MSPEEDRLLAQGRHLRLLCRQGWEFAQRTRAHAVVTVLAVTPDDRVLLVEQYREPLGQIVIELPAGLAGDVEEDATASLAEVARRELIEETGYDADVMEPLTRGPSSAGLTDEVITFFWAKGLTKVGAGGGVELENIVVHAIPRLDLADWLARREGEGTLVDPKVYAGLYFLVRHADDSPY